MVAVCRLRISFSQLMLDIPLGCMAKLHLSSCLWRGHKKSFRSQIAQGGYFNKILDEKIRLIALNNGRYI